MLKSVQTLANHWEIEVRSLICTHFQLIARHLFVPINTHKQTTESNLILF